MLMPELVWVVGGVVGLLLLDRLGLWAESRGWIYWRKRRGRSLGSGVLGGMAEVFQPNQVHYVRELKRERRLSTVSGQAHGGEDERRGASGED